MDAFDLKIICLHVYMFSGTFLNEIIIEHIIRGLRSSLTCDLRWLWDDRLVLISVHGDLLIYSFAGHSSDFLRFFFF